MHSTQLSKVASNLVGQGRHNVEESGLMTGERGKDNKLITVWKKKKVSKAKLVLETNADGLNNQLACQTPPGKFQQMILNIEPCNTITLGKTQQWIGIARVSFYFCFSFSVVSTVCILCIHVNVYLFDALFLWSFQNMGHVLIPLAHTVSILQRLIRCMCQTCNLSLYKRPLSTSTAMVRKHNFRISLPILDVLFISHFIKACILPNWTQYILITFQLQSTCLLAAAL